MTAVDFCRLLLDELRSYAGDLPIQTIKSDILNFSAGSGRHPALIVCMGDTLTHLPAPAAVEDLIRKCYSELNPGGRLVLSLRDYSREPDGAVAVIPVMRSAGRIFLCRLEYQAETITVQDILFSSGQGFWERTAGNYTKIRVAPQTLTRMLNRAGFRNEYSAVNNGMIEVIAQKGA